MPIDPRMYKSLSQPTPDQTGMTNQQPGQLAMALGQNALSQGTQDGMRQAFNTPQQPQIPQAPQGNVLDNQAASKRADQRILSAPNTLEELRAQNAAKGIK